MAAGGGGGGGAPAPFRVSVPDAELQYLKERLGSTRFPDILSDIRPWEDGTDLEYFKEFVEYWRKGYDWRAWEARLNAFDQFTLEVQGIQMHFVHERSPEPDAVPLLLLHGWPGSYFEFYKLIPMLQEGGRFHIVAPSLPGYGFSSAPTKRGCGATAIAGIMDELMGALGYDKYIAQGGDWGGIICRALAKSHAPRCAAVHVNMCVATPSFTSPWHIVQIANIALAPSLPLALTADEMKGVQDMRAFQKRETAYQKIQGTKPQTLAYALQDSPAGLAAWILEKFQTWSDCHGNPESALSKDEMLTNIGIYWFGGRIASSMRLYKETIANRTEMGAMLSGYSPTPVGVAVFPKELFRPPRSWVGKIYNLQQWSVMDRGGHFAALEQPRLLADDILKFVRLAKDKAWV
ncbi:MAG: putative hydrolase [Monoraphidium minutum]|nr:MAG: putative hydrolase [Monoraphidium minutum]